MLVHFPIALVTFGYIAELGSIFIKKEGGMALFFFPE
jgi:uncharacterized membrane protein